MLCLALLLAALPVILPVFTSATAADDQEEQLLGTLSQRFEASGPGVISSGSGDAGGKSYGAYQFSSRPVVYVWKEGSYELQATSNE